MPYRRPYRNRRTNRNRVTKRTYKKAKRVFMRNMKKRSIQYNTGRSVIANRYVTKLVYSDNYAAANLVGSISWLQYRLNSLFDPDFTVGGHQPMGFDQLLPTLYRLYTVTGCKVVIEGRFTSDNLTTDPVLGNLIVGAIPVQNAGVFPATLSAANESRNYVTVSRTDQSLLRFKKYFDVSKYYGAKRSQIIDEAGFSGTSTSDPVNSLILQLGFVPTFPNSVIGFQFSITLVYYCQLYSPQQLTQS